MVNYTGLIQAIKDHSEVITELEELHATVGATPEGKARYKLLSGKLYSIEIYISEEMQSIPTDHHAHILAEEIWNNSPVKNTEKQEALKKALIDVLTLMAVTSNVESKEPAQTELAEMEMPKVETPAKSVDCTYQDLIDAIQEHCEVVCKLDELRHKLRATKAEKECYAKSATRLDKLEAFIKNEMRAIPTGHHAHTVYKEVWHGMPIKNTERENAWKQVLIDVLRNLPA